MSGAALLGLVCALALGISFAFPALAFVAVCVAVCVVICLFARFLAAPW